MLITIFWICTGIVVYAYAGYPMCLWLAARFLKRPVAKGPYEPQVSIILAAFNEEKHIEKKLLNLLNLGYPEQKVEILVGSDGASDQTDEIISRFRSPRIRFFRFVSNFGKPHVLNALVREAHGTVLVFTDARQTFEKDALRQLVENFHDPKVGCVTGELLFKETNKEAAVGKGMGVYWNYEKFMRKKESEIGSMLGATGAIYAIRRRLYTPVPTNVVVDDMYIPLAIISRGYRAIFDPAARAFDAASLHGKQEFRRKVRTLIGNWQIFQYFSDLFNPFTSPIAIQMISHKFLRLLVPYFLITAFSVNALLAGDVVYRCILLLQIVFYFLAGWEAYNESERAQGKRKHGVGYIPYIFCLLNYSAMVSLYKFLTEKQTGSWKKAYA